MVYECLHEAFVQLCRQWGSAKPDTAYIDCTSLSIAMNQSRQ